VADVEQCCSVRPTGEGRWQQVRNGNHIVLAKAPGVVLTSSVPSRLWCAVAGFSCSVPREQRGAAEVLRWSASTRWLPLRSTQGRQSPCPPASLSPPPPPPPPPLLTDRTTLHWSFNEKETGKKILFSGGTTYKRNSFKAVTTEIRLFRNYLGKMNFNIVLLCFYVKILKIYEYDNTTCYCSVDFCIICFMSP